MTAKRKHSTVPNKIPILAPIMDEGYVNLYASDITVRKRVEEDIQLHNEDMAFLNVINTAINRGESLESLIHLISKETERIFHSMGVTLHLLDPIRQRLVMQNLALSPAMVKKINNVIGVSIPRVEYDLNADHPYRQVMDTGSSKIINDLEGIQDFTAGYLSSVHLTDKMRSKLRLFIPAIVKLLGYQSVLVVPLISGSEVIGTLDMGRREQFTEDDAKRLEIIAGQLTAVLKHKQAEEALHESEVRYRGLFEDSPISLWEEDFSAVKRRLDALRKRGVKDFRAYLKSHPQVTTECAALVQIVEVNKATLELYQAGNKEELLKNLATIFRDDSYESFREELVHIAEGKTQFSWEGTNETLDGKRLDVSLSWLVAPGHETNLSKVIISIIDITERKRAEEEIQRLSRFPEENPNPVLRFDKTGRILYANQSSAPLLASWEREAGQDLPADWRRQVASVFGTGRSKELEMVCQERIFSCNLVPIIDEGYVNLYGSDITERKRVEEKLRVLSTRQEAILAAVPDILMEVNKDKVYTWANPAGVEFFGEDVIGKEADFYFEGKQDTYDVVETLFNGSEDLFYVESWQRRKDGEKRLLAWWCRVLKDADGNVVGALSSAHDITERKRAEALQEAIYQIGEAADKTASLEDLYSTLHAIIGRVMQARNFYIALYDAGNARISFPYFVDEVDKSVPAAPVIAGQGMTEYVIRTGKPLLSDTANFEELVRQGEVELVGSPSPIWLGAPLVVEGQTIGVIAAQDYSDPHVYGEQELRILEFVSGQVAKAIQSKRAETALRESEERFRNLVQTVPDAVITINQQGNIVYWNPKAETIFGYSSSEVIGRPLALTMPEDARQRVLGGMLKAISSGASSMQGRSFETVGLRKNGSEFPTEISLATWETAEGAFFTSIVRDITERKQAEARYRSIVEQVPAIFYTEALDHRVIFVSPKIETILGYTPEEWMSDPGFWKRSVHPDDLERVGAEDESTNQSSEPFQIEYRVIRKDGRMVWLRDQASLVKDGGKPLFWQGVMYDISAEKESETALRTSEERYRMLAENMSDTVWLMDMNLKNIYISPSVTKLRGYTLEESNSLPLDQQMTPESLARVIQLFAETLTPERLAQHDLPITVTAELEFYKKDGSKFWSENTFVLIRAADGTPTSILGTGRDITERKRAEEEILHRINELEVLYENGLAISRILEPHEIGEKIIEILNRRLNWHHAAIRLYDPHKNRLDVLAFNHPGLTEQERLVHLEKLRKRVADPGKGLSGWVIQHGKSILCEDVRQEPRYVRTYPGIRSGLYVPLKAGTNVIGSIAIESTRVEAFTAQDQRLLETVAAQAAITIENARLYQDTVRAAERRAVLYHASQEIAAAGLDLEQIYRSIHQAASQLMPLDLFAITLVDENQKVLHGVYLIDRGERYPAVDAEWGTGLAGYVIREKKSIRIADYHKQKPAKAVWFGGPGTPRSIISVPLHSGTKIVGVLSVQNYRADIYGEEDEILLKTLAAYAGTAIENSRLFAETRRRAAELSVLVGVSSAMRTASTPAEMYSVIVDMVMELFHADGASLSLHDTLTGENIVMAGGGQFADYVGYRVPPGVGGTGIVIRTGEPYLTLDSRADEHVYNPNPSPDMGAMAFVPLATREGIIGVLSAGREGAISETDVSLLTAIADIAANAIENSRLFESEHEQHQLSDALRVALSAGASLSSTLDFDEVLDHLLGAVEGILPYDDASILLVDHSGREAAIARTRGRAPDGEKISQFFKDFRFNVTTTENLRWMAEHKQPLVIPDVTSYPGWITVEGTEAIRSWAGAPIIVNGKVIAFFSLAKYVINFYGPQHARLLEAFTGQASLAFQNARLFAETQSRLRFLTALHTIDTAIGASVDLRITLSIILENVTRELKVDAAAVALMNPHSRLLEYTASRGFRSRIVEGLRVKPGDGLAGQAAIQRHTVSSSDAGQADGKNGSGTDSFKDEGFASQYAIPLIAKGQIQGILQLCHRTELNPGQDWLDFLNTLAGQAAIAIDNARMFENLQTSNLDLLLAYDATIQGWAQALDMRDRETEDHTRRVADITLTLAGAMSMNDSELEHIRRGALLHDIGKIGIPDIILLKPGPLTDEEWAIMRTHPVKAYEMLSPIAYLHPALDIPYCHHEKWDGSGYPRGLNGAQIPLAARIFAVVDVFDALTSDRPYRSAWSREQALDYIKEQTGKHFDPRVVEVFLKMKNQAA